MINSSVEVVGRGEYMYFSQQLRFLHILVPPPSPLAFNHRTALTGHLEGLNSIQGILLQRFHCKDYRAQHVQRKK